MHDYSIDNKNFSINIKVLKIKRLLYKYLLFLGGTVFIIYISGTLKIDQGIADKSQGYFVHRNIEQANEAGKLGYIKYEVNDYAAVFGIPWKWGSGVRRIIRSGPDDFDDIGYIVLLELIAIAGKEITIEFLENMHNLSYIISAVILSFIILRLCRNILAGWIFIILALILKSNILSLVYGSPDSRTFVLSFPFIIISILFGINWLSLYLNKSWAKIYLLFIGGLIGMIFLIRSSEGIAAILTISFFVILYRIDLKKKIFSIFAPLALGHLLVTIVMPSVFALHRDFKTGEFNGDIIPYLQTSGVHQTWHSVVAGIGRYPNSIDMRYDDTVIYRILRARFPDAMDPVLNIHGKGYFPGLRTIWLEYIEDHPLEYLKNLIKAYAELFYFIPYATSVGNLTWSYGYLPLKHGVIADEWDFPPSLAPHGQNLINVRYRYLNLSYAEWGIYILVIFAITLGIIYIFLNRAVSGNERLCFLFIIFYIFLLTIMRAIVPQHGFSLIVGFWIFSFMLLLYIFFTNPLIKILSFQRLKIFFI